ncbi:MAG: glutamate-ammonia-ligase adenylyltransferase [Ascidiaceihabitans sp.]|jgi:glutamate-ammonia-ligase adenylyltransferase
MNLAQSLTRTPRIFNDDRGRDAVALLPDIGPELTGLIHGAASASPYLSQLIGKEFAWLPDAMLDVDAAVQAELAACLTAPYDMLAPQLRRSKRRIALLTGLADLGGAWALHKVTGALTDLADTACTAALRAGIAAQIKRGKLPGLTEDDIETAGGMVVLAMGKMGAFELNYSSDIDLICLFDEARFDVADFGEARAGFIRATRQMSSLLNDLTGDGYVFRTDLRLRPDPAVTPVCMGMEAAERYYESLGRTWERAAYIKARPAAGDLAAGDAFIKTLRPFVWRKHLDFAAIQDAHDMRLAIREHKGLGGPITLSGHNMKLGRGGIREIEFFTQTRQLIAGGRDRTLRMRGTCEGLAALADKGWVEPELAAVLTDHYTAHRTVEHRLQMVRDAQTHNLPTSDAGFDRLAALMDMDRADLEADLHNRLHAVHEATEGFFAPDDSAKVANHDLDQDLIERWHSYPALRTQRGAATFERIKPALLARLSQASKPNEALRALDGFLQGLPAGVQLFSLFDANPSLVDLLVDIVSTSPALAQHLSRNAAVFDAVIGGDFFSPWPGDGLQGALEQALSQELDYEAKLDMTRRWAKEWHFRIGVHLLRGLITPFEAGAQYSDLARAVLGALWPEVVAQFATRHGTPPGRGAVILGMGSLGAGALNPASDLDMIVIYDPADVEASDGKRPLPARQYYARLTQAMITALTVPMAQGRLYEVDMRLRPSGNKGPVATSWASFDSYQRTQAWVWEHLALTRAQVIVGDADLTKQVEGLRRDILENQTDAAHIITEVATMRTRIADAKTPVSVWEPKIGAGRMQDIELLAQAGALINPTSPRKISEGLTACVAANLLSDADRQVLLLTYEMCWTLQICARLLTGDVLDPNTVGSGAMSFVCRTLKADSPEALETDLIAAYAAAAKIIDATVGNVSV